MLFYFLYFHRTFVPLFPSRTSSLLLWMFGNGLHLELDWIEWIIICGLWYTRYIRALERMFPHIYTYTHTHTWWRRWSREASMTTVVGSMDVHLAGYRWVLWLHNWWDDGIFKTFLLSSYANFHVLGPFKPKKQIKSCRRCRTGKFVSTLAQPA